MSFLSHVPYLNSYNELCHFVTRSDTLLAAVPEGQGWNSE